MNSNWFRSTCVWGALFGGSFLGLGAIHLLTKGRTPLIKKREDRIFMVSRVISMTHAISMVVFSVKILLNHSARWTIENTELQDLMLINSVGYFTYDLAYMLLFEPSWMFTLHHLLSMGVLASSWYLGMGGYNMAALAVFGEITNPLQLLWTICRRHKMEGPANVISQIFTWSFIVLRCVVIPAVTCQHMVWVWNELPLPLPWLLAWTSIGAALNLTGIWWSYLLWKGYNKKLKLSEMSENIDEVSQVHLDELQDETKEKYE